MRNFYKDRSTGERYEYDDQQVAAGCVLPNLTRMTAEEVQAHLNPEKSEAELREAWKVERASQVASITVEVDGRVFDGDEISQGRMARAIIGMQSQPEGSTVQWVLHDNSVVSVGLAELQEALTLAGLRQTELWIKP